MKPNIPLTLLSILSATFSAMPSALAQNTFYADGDLVLFFQRPGSNNTIYVSLGNAANLYRGSAAGPTADRQVINIINIDSALTTAFTTFDGDWKDDTSIFAGLAACWSASPNSTTHLNGDPHRTLYTSQPRNTLGTPGSASSEAWDFSTSGFSGPATNILAMNAKLESEYLTQAAVSPLSISTIDDQNPIETAPGGILLQPSAFGAFPGGVQQRSSAGTLGTFGPVSQVKFALDLYRILPRISVAGQVTGPDKTGSYEGTIVVGIDGNVSFITQGAAVSAYDTWMANFPSITAPADKLETADPDGDGVTNLEEFGFGGNPALGSDTASGQLFTVDSDADTQKDISLTLEVRSGATFSASGNDLVSSVIDDVTYRIEGSTDLINWDSQVLEASPTLSSGSPSTGYAFKTFRLVGGNGLTGKGFIRASVSK